MGFRGILLATTGAGVDGAAAAAGGCIAPFSGSTSAAVGTDWKAGVAFRRLYRNQINAAIIATPAMTPIAIPALAPALRPDEPAEQEKEPLKTPSDCRLLKCLQERSPEPWIEVFPFT